MGCELRGVRDGSFGERGLRGRVKVAFIKCRGGELFRGRTGPSPFPNDANWAERMGEGASGGANARPA